MIKFMGATDTGRMRQQNQDAFICRRVGENAGYAIVCDGMGGEQAGDVASTTACQLIEKFFHRDVNETMSEAAAKAVIFSAISAANAKVYSMAKENPDYHGMGTTLVLAVVVGECMHIVNIGDSRIYMVEKRSIRSLLTAMLSAVINIALNLWCFLLYGVNGAAAATLVCYVVVFVVRLVDTRKFVRIKWDYFRLILNAAVLMTQCYCVLREVPYWILYELALFALMLLVNGRGLIVGVRRLFRKKPAG